MAGAGTTTSKKGPLPGVYMEFVLPIKEDKKDDDKSTQETLYCKEPVGIFLGLQVADARVGTFEGKNTSTKGKKFALRAKKGQKTFTLLLKSGTKIDVQKFGAKSKTSREIDRLSVSFPNTITVSELREYLMTKSGAKDKILGFITPQGRLHTWQGTLGTRQTKVETSTI